MAVIHDLNVKGSSFVQQAEMNILKELFAEQFWQWFDDHLELEVLKINWKIIRKTFRVKDIKPIFVLLFGEHP